MYDQTNNAKVKELFDEYGISPSKTVTLDEALKKYVEIYGKDSSYEIVTDRHILHRNDPYTDIMERQHIGHTCLYKKLNTAYSRIAAILYRENGEVPATFKQKTNNECSMWKRLESAEQELEETLKSMPDIEWEKILPEDVEEISAKLEAVIERINIKVSSQS